MPATNTSGPTCSSRSSGDSSRRCAPRAVPARRWFSPAERRPRCCTALRSSRLGRASSRHVGLLSAPGSSVAREGRHEREASCACTATGGRRRRSGSGTSTSQIERCGWAVVGVEGDRGSPPFAYTVGLTRYHDHPELVVSGAEPQDGAATLNALAAHVRDGHRYAVGDVVASFTPHRYRMLRVNDPRRLAVAQEIYAEAGARLVEGLQVVWTDHDGRWPWDPRWTDRRTRQELFGRPPRTAA